MRYHITSASFLLISVTDYFNSGQHTTINILLYAGYIGLIAYYLYQIFYYTVVLKKCVGILKGRILEIDGNVEIDKDVIITVVYIFEGKEYVIVKTVSSDYLEP